MTETIHQTKTESKIVECYLCNQEVSGTGSMKVPLTTGGTVLVHSICMEFYLAKTNNQNNSACGGCTGGAGCC